MKICIAKFFLAIGLLVVATARTTSANLITNGDFETGTFAGWTTTPAPVGSNFGVTFLPPAHDTLGAFFGATGSDFDSISQTFATTPGAFYEVSFFYQVVEPGSPPDNGFRVLFNNVVIFENLNAISGFGTFTFHVQATSNMTSLEFQGRNVQGFDYLDDVSVTPFEIRLTASGRRVQGKLTADLVWQPVSTQTIEIYRDSQLIATVPNNGAYTDSIGVRGGNVHYTYKVCEPGGSVCSNDATVRFGGSP
jgi:hypothetical protein